MTSNEIKKSIRKQLTGDFEKDKQFLSDKSEEYMKENDEEGISAVIDLLSEIMPEEYQKSIMRIMYINGKRLDKVYADIIEMLKSTGVELSGKHAVVIGRSNIVGKPTALLLLNENCTVTVCHSKTENIKEICRQADILVTAVGKPEFVTADFIKDGAVVIDVGINRTADGLKGDVDFYGAAKKASYISPVPGGVGPMTIACLMKNTCICAFRREKIEY